MLEEPVCIIGAGIAGLSIAAELSSKGFNVWVLEEHNTIGLPKHCTGIISYETLQRIKKYAKDYIINEFREYTIKTEDLKHTITLEFKYPAILLDRVELERGLAELTKSAGTKLFTGFKVLGVINSKGLLVKTSKMKKSFNTLIIAEGPKRLISKKLGIYRSKLKFLSGLQSIVTCRNAPRNPVIYVGKNVSEGFFGWFVPLDEHKAIVGLADKLGNNIPIKYRHKYLIKLIEKSGVRIHRIVEWFGGLIPMDKPVNPVLTYRILLAGDAASHIKPLTGGGIYAISLLIKCMDKVINEGDFYHSLSQCMKPVINLLNRQHSIRKVIRLMGYHQAVKLITAIGIRSIKVSNYDAIHESLLRFFR